MVLNLSTESGKGEGWGGQKKLNYRNSDLVSEARVSQEVHKICNRENGGLTEKTRQGRVTTLREKGQKGLLIASIILRAINKMLTITTALHLWQNEFSLHQRYPQIKMNFLPYAM